MLKRFYKLRNEIADFMQIKNKPLSELSDPKWICDLAFLVDLTSYFNNLELKFQKQGQLVNYLYIHLKAFQNKVRLWVAQMLSGNSYHFTTLSAYENVVYAQYAKELKLLLQQFSNRFSDFKNMEDCFNLFTTPTKSNVQNAPIHLEYAKQMEFIEIQENSLLKSKFEDVELCDFYKNTSKKKTIFRNLGNSKEINLAKLDRRELRPVGEAVGVRRIGLFCFQKHSYTHLEQHFRLAVKIITENPVESGQGQVTRCARDDPSSVPFPVGSQWCTPLYVTEPSPCLPHTQGHGKILVF
ncbi:General transcription factor II-I repeat domain-containing protein 2 [Eumeta japonica]|uniref:General transcription factor II-I repeat domain-containing protein 2 n=1 Tax=Eumeta variegata TaxID=151549 RepID=A0A4C1WFA1_EUMVA|nr:General transcription factor II-I repeat domain-containing protein 2 [Eumeta japonica]